MRIMLHTLMLTDIISIISSTHTRRQRRIHTGTLAMRTATRAISSPASPSRVLWTYSTFMKQDGDARCCWPRETQQSFW